MPATEKVIDLRSLKNGRSLILHTQNYISYLSNGPSQHQWKISDMSEIPKKVRNPRTQLFGTSFSLGCVPMMNTRHPEALALVSRSTLGACAPWHAKCRELEIWLKISSAILNHFWITIFRFCTARRNDPNTNSLRWYNSHSACESIRFLFPCRSFR